MKDFNIEMFDNIDMNVAFPVLLSLYAEISANTQRLYHLAMEYASEDMSKAYNDNLEKQQLVKEKIMEYWRIANEEFCTD